MISTESGREKQVTFGGGRLLLQGETDWVYQEEFDVRSGYRWSPDSKRLAFIELDERSVPVYPIIEQTSELPKADFQSYPKAWD